MQLLPRHRRRLHSSHQRVLLANVARRHARPAEHRHDALKVVPVQQVVVCLHKRQRRLEEHRHALQEQHVKHAKRGCRVEGGRKRREEPLARIHGRCHPKVFKVGVQVRARRANKLLKLIQAQGHVCHRRLEHPAQPEVAHQDDKQLKRLLLGHVHEQHSHNKRRPLAVAHLCVIQRVRLHHVEQNLLPFARLLLELAVLGKRAGEVLPDLLLVRRGLRNQLGIPWRLVCVLARRVLLAALLLRAREALPHHAAQRPRHAVIQQLLQPPLLLLVPQLPVGQHLCP